jgi:hypothetical protein
MAKRILALAIAGVLLAPFAAHAADGPHGRSVRTQAALDATLWSHHKGVEVLTSVCTRPARQRGCSPMSPRLRAELEAALRAPITWVNERRGARSTFLVFAPVVFDAREATAELAWWGPAPGGCAGGYRTSFRRQQGAWTWYQQLGWAGCPGAR